MPQRVKRLSVPIGKNRCLLNILNVLPSDWPTWSIYWDTYAVLRYLCILLQDAETTRYLESQREQSNYSGDTGFNIIGYVVPLSRLKSKYGPIRKSFTVSAHVFIENHFWKACGHVACWSEVAYTWELCKLQILSWIKVLAHILILCTFHTAYKF